MSKGFYHPSDIFRLKRQLAADAQNFTSSIVDSSNLAANKEEDKPQVRPEGVGGILFDALAYIDQVDYKVSQIWKELDGLSLFTEAALDVKLADTERKPLNKKFVKARTRLDDLAKLTLINGDALLSGKFAHKGKEIVIDEKGEEKMVIRIDPLHAAALGLDRVKINTLPAAKKAMEQILKARTKITEAKDVVKSRRDSVEFKQARWSSSQDFEVKAKNQVVDRTGGTTFALLDLRSRQERAAEDKGRTQGLLVNFKA